MYSGAGHIDMLSNESFFLPSRTERLILKSLTDGNEVFALATLNFDENLLIGREKKFPLTALTGVSIKRVEVRENVWAFLRDKANCP